MGSGQKPRKKKFDPPASPKSQIQNCLPISLRCHPELGEGPRAACALKLSILDLPSFASDLGRCFSSLAACHSSPASSITPFLFNNILEKRA
jgi:hypothetical protein